MSETEEAKKPRQPRETLTIHLSAGATAGVRTIAGRFGVSQASVLAQLGTEMDNNIKGWLARYFEELKLAQPDELFS